MDDLLSPVLVESPKKGYEVVVYDQSRKPFIVDTVRDCKELRAMCRKLIRIKRAYVVIAYQFGHAVGRCKVSEIKEALA